MKQPEALRLAEWCDTFNTVTHDQTAAELRRLHAEVERLRAQHSATDQFEDALDMVAGEATVKESLPVDWMKLALTVVWNFPSHPGSHPGDRSDEMYDEDPVTAWRDGWIAAVDALHARLTEGQR
jgi:hypothetical protein